MFYNSEESFVDKFIACLKKLSVVQIPFDTPAFYNGIEQMKLCFQDNREDLGEVSNEISLLLKIHLKKILLVLEMLYQSKMGGICLLKILNTQSV